MASVLPIVAKYGLQASVAIGALGAAMTVCPELVRLWQELDARFSRLDCLQSGIAVLGVTVGVAAFGVAMVQRVLVYLQWLRRYWR